MRTRTLVTTLLLGLAIPAAARSVDVRMTSFGAQIGASAVVAAGVFEDSGIPPSEAGHALRLRIDTVVNGGPRADAIVRFAVGAPRPDLGARRLVFLVADGEDGEFRLGLDLMSVVPLAAAGHASAALTLAIRQTAFLEDEVPEEDERTAYRGLLVQTATGADALLALSALLDLVGDEALVAALAVDERASLRVRFGTVGVHDARRRWLVEVLGVARDALAAVHFVNALPGKDGRALRPSIGRALRRIDDDEAARRLLELRTDGVGRVRSDVANALGRWDRPGFRSPLERMLRDDEAGVREEVAVALGRMRRSRSFTALRDALGSAEAFRVRRAIVWALGRLDTPESLTLVGVVSRTAEDARLRRWAEQVRRRPQSPYTLR